MDLLKLKRIFKDNGCQKVYAKVLSPNDNSKNQVYLAGSFDILNIFPISEITSDSSGDWKRDRFKATLNFFWIGEEDNIYLAPKTKLVLYPKYPEVRFSGFLAGCKSAPSSLMTSRDADRILFLAPNKQGQVIGYVTPHNSNLANEFFSMKSEPNLGIFHIINIESEEDNKEILIKELKRIHKLDWIPSKRLNSNGISIACNASNCGGYTLEAELGITPNGFSEPDYLGWEIKQFGVKKLENINASVITLMTPEPNGGIYKEEGVEAFLRGYGYKDMRGREDRINFGGVHKVGLKHKKTDLTLHLVGFDSESGKIRNSDGKIVLVDENDIETASWSFTALLKHWNKKHNQACYVPSLSSVEHQRQYKYGNNILLGIGTDFQLFLKEMYNGNIYYDPATKMESASTNPEIKRRNQFRVKSQFLGNLYKEKENIDLNQQSD